MREYSGIWSKSYLGISEFSEDNSNLASIVKSIDANRVEVELSVLWVTEHGFLFTAVPKDCGDDFALSTRMIDISELDKEDNLILIE